MVKTDLFSVRFSAAVVFMFYCYIPCAGSIIIGNMEFDMAVLNGQASSSDYSFTQTNGTVTLSGHQPTASAAVTYFLNHTSGGDESNFITSVDISRLSNANSEAGLMFYAGNFQSAIGSKEWCRLAVTGDRKIYLEYKSSDCLPSQRVLLYTLSTTATIVYIQAEIIYDYPFFSISFQPPSVSAWLPLGGSSSLPRDHSFGIFLQPVETAIQENAAFGSFSIYPRIQTNGLDTIYKNIQTVGITGFGDWFNWPLPSNFFNMPLNFIKDIKDQYNSSTEFYDPYQKKLFDNMQGLINIVTKPITGSEPECINNSIYNARIYLADIVNSYITGAARKYPPGSTEYQLYFGFSLGGLLQQGIDLITACKKASDVHWYDFLNPIEPFIRAWNIGDCTSDIVDALQKMDNIKEVATNKDELIENAALYIKYLTLIAVLDKDLPAGYNGCINLYISQVRDYTRKIAPTYNNNNIPMKVFSSIALWDLAHGNTSSSAYLNLLCKNKFMDGGGYAEGSHYLDWLNQELLPYYYIATYEGWLPANLQLPGVKNSGYWLLNMADKSGVIAPVDDGTNDERFWLAPYAFLNNDGAFKDYVANSLPDGSSDPLLFLTYSPKNSHNGDWILSPIGIYEGVGKINFKTTDKGDVSVTLITEKSGPIKENGGSHDQQDDGSISLRRCNPDHPLINDNLIFDPGYAGYKDKGREEYFSFHNTVQINTHPYGGITPCPYGDGKYWMDVVDNALGIDISGLADNLLAEIFFLGNTGKVASYVLSNKYSDLKNMPLERKAAGGPGYSDIVNVFSNGFEAKISFDSLPGVNYALRTVLHVDDDVFVIDRISSNQNDYSIHYNLPRGSRASGADNIYIGTSGYSKIRLSAYCSDDLKPSFYKDTAYAINEISGKYHDSTKVTRVRFTNAGTHLPASPDAYCGFLTVLEPADGTFTYGEAYAPVSGDVGDAQICLSRALDANIIRYVFVNTVTNGVKGTIRIPALTGWHDVFTADAEYGVIDFNKTSNTIQNLRIYKGTSATYGGIDFVVKDVFQPGTIQKAKIGSIVNGIVSYDPGAAMHTLSMNWTSIGQLFGYVYFEGDFTATAKIEEYNESGAAGISALAGMMAAEDLSGGSKGAAQKVWAEEDCSSGWGSFVWIQHGAGAEGRSLPKDHCQMKGVWLRIQRVGDKVDAYYSLDGTTFEDFCGYTGQIFSCNTITTNSRGLYIGLYLPSGGTVKFTNFTIVRPAANNFTEGFAKKATLSSLGYSGRTSSASWGLNPYCYMYTSTPGGADYPAVITTPPFKLNRNDGNGVSVEYKVKFPTWYYNQNLRNNNKLTIDISGADPNNKYSLFFMPSTNENVHSGYDLQFTKHSDPVVLAQTLTNTITPLGETAPWLKFRIDFLKTQSQGGTGEIKVYYDIGDGLGYVQEMGMMDETYTDFKILTFTYKTGAGVDNYQVRVADISVTTLNSQMAPPSIKVQPSDYSVSSGSTVTFSVAADGAQPLSYKWLRNGQAISGATQASYTILSISVADAGSTFQCIVQNQYGTAFSRIATLTIRDVTPPTTGVSLSSAPNSVGWNNTDVTVSLSSTDLESGVKCLTYAASGATVIAAQTVFTSTATIPLSAEGTTTVTYFAQDKSGNIETSKSITVLIDKTVPSPTTASLSPLPNSAGVNNTDVTLSLSSTDLGSGVKSITYSATGANPISLQTTASSSTTLQLTAEGSTTVTYFAQDNAGNAEAARSITVKIDKTALLSLYGPAFASSYESQRYVASKATDGDTTCGRWSSKFTDNEWYIVDLGAVQTVRSIRLFWEAASAKSYTVQVSSDGINWNTIVCATNKPNGPRVDNLANLSVSGRYVKMQGTSRNTCYGYSLYEAKIYGLPSTSVQNVKLTRLSSQVFASSTEGSYVPSNVVDNDSSRWGSAWYNVSNQDCQWIYIDLGSVRTISDVYLEWETAFGKDYEIQVSNNASTWTTVKTMSCGDGKNDLFMGINVSGRYVRMEGIHRGTCYGYSLYDFEVFGH